jgi:hypothetical protein
MKTIPQEFEKDYWGMFETYLELGYPKIEAYEIADAWLEDKIYGEA